MSDEYIDEKCHYFVTTRSVEIKALHPTKLDDEFQKALELHKQMVLLAFGLPATLEILTKQVGLATEGFRELSKAVYDLEYSNPESEKVHDGKASNTN